LEEPHPSQAPYEAIITLIREMSQKLNNSEMTFPPALLIPMLEKYAAEHQAGIGPIHWLPDLFIAVNIPFENICSTMQAMLFQNLAPFTGRGKRPLAEHLLYICEQWLEECVRKNVVPYGGEQNAVEIDELVNLMVTQGDLGAAEMERAAELRRKIVRCFS
jgi:nuclear pore complex protein Nup155